MEPENTPQENVNTTPQEPEKEPRHSRGVLSVIAFVVTVLAWVALPLYYVVALGGSVVAVILSILALRQPRGAWRNLALVSIVASAVLLLVLAIFLSGLAVLLSY